MSAPLAPVFAAPINPDAGRPLLITPMADGSTVDEVPSEFDDASDAFLTIQIGQGIRHSSPVPLDEDTPASNPSVEKKAWSCIMPKSRCNACDLIQTHCKCKKYCTYDKCKKKSMRLPNSIYVCDCEAAIVQRYMNKEPSCNKCNWKDYAAISAFHARLYTRCFCEE